MQLYKKISARHYIALTAMFVQVLSGSLRIDRNEQVSAHQVIQEVKFPNIFGVVVHLGTVVVHPYCRFPLRLQMAPQQSAKF